MLGLFRNLHIATQLVFLVVTLVLASVFAFAYLAERDIRSSLEVRAAGDLADEARLRAHALRDDLRRLARRARDFGAVAVALENNPDRPVRPDVLAAALRGKFAKDVADKGQAAEDAAFVREVAVVRVGKDGLAAETVLRPNPIGELEPVLAPTPTHRELVQAMESAADRQVISPPVATGPPGAKGYAMTVSYGPLEKGPPGRHLLLTFDLTALIAKQARNLPQNLLFVRAGGTWVHHPQAALVGTDADTWGELPEPADNADAAGSYLTPRELPEMEFFLVRKLIKPGLSHSAEARRQLLAKLASMPDLRFGRLPEGAQSITLSSASPKTLATAREAVRTAEVDDRPPLTAVLPVQPPPGEISEPIPCRTFAGYHLPRETLGFRGGPFVELIVAAGQEEFAAEAQSAISRLRWRSLLPLAFVSAALAIGVGFWLTRPLGRLTEASRRIAEGRSVGDVPTNAPGEVGELARSFVSMGEQIRLREIRLRESEMSLRTILDNAADGIITFDQSGEIRQANSSAEEMFGYRPGQLLGRKVQKLMRLPSKVVDGLDLPRPGDVSNFLGMPGGVSVFVNAVKIPGEEHLGVRADGSTFWMEVTFSKVPLEDRRIITGIFRDITVRKRAEEERGRAEEERARAEERVRQVNATLDALVKLRTAQHEDARAKLEVALTEARAAVAAKDAFIRVISHELRTPLTAVMGLTENLRLAFLNPTTAGAKKVVADPVANFDRILTPCKHLLTLINDLLDVGRYTAGQSIELRLGRFALAPFLKGVVEMARPLARKFENSLVAVIPPDLGEAVNDETRLRQVLLNLLSNAAKFTEAGTITLTVERRRDAGKPDLLVFRVRDTGEGMSRVQLAQLFKPFYRADNSLSRKQGGTGLGLAISKMICELMGGDVTVESEPGSGSTFTVTVAAEVTTEARRDEIGKPDDPSIPAAPGATVLVIEDDPALRETIDAYLQPEGYHVVHAAGGEEGIALAKSLRPACITLDVMLPGMDAWAVLSRLKNDAATRDVPVVMLALGEERGGFALGATEYLTKPIDWTRLGEIICRYHIESRPVLIVDDDEMQRNYLRDLLVHDQWTRVVEAADGRQALKVCEAETPCLILLDLVMPVMDGFAFLEELRRRPEGETVPVVVLTAMQLTDDDRRRLNGGVARVAARGELTAETLLRRVRDHVRGATPPAAAIV